MDGHSGWQPDPTGRHQERYFNDNGIPTDLVRDDGIEFTDEDRVESNATQQGPPRVIARRISPPFPTPGPPEVTMPPKRADDTQPVLVTRYSTPAVVVPTPDAPTGQIPAVASHHAPAVDLVWRRPWWLIVTMCVLLVLLIAASFFAVQQHQDANKWMNQYHAEVTDNHSEAVKSAALFVSLLASQQRATAVTNQKNKACLVLESLTRDTRLLATAACTE